MLASNVTIELDNLPVLLHISQSYPPPPHTHTHTHTFRQTDSVQVFAITPFLYTRTALYWSRPSIDVSPVAFIVYTQRLSLCVTMQCHMSAAVSPPRSDMSRIDIRPHRQVQ